ncbi:hypothetical protein SLEP1_g3167 [Rubroshorea leprosula]|uniref:Uncharacterized protein n=1 Tax=Rubroshorea leprosula TaxID=152421 RepID=A0AAV5HQX4_9ROSI|nr:hypothetical protein SLEP1_g3167 [Rubroshorea leprosula]
MAYFFSPFSSFSPARFCSSFFPLQPENPPLQAASTSFEKLVRKLGISPPFLSKNLIWNPEIFPPAGNSRSALLCSPAALVVGANCLGFGLRDSSLQLPPAFSSPCSSGFSWKILVPDRSAN